VEQRLSLLTLGVRDVGRARTFYEALGWTTRAGPDDDVVFFRSGGTILALWARDRLAEDSAVEDAGGWGGVTLAHDVRSPDEVDAVLDEAKAAGATIARPAGPTFWAATPASSLISTAIRGRSRTTRNGRSPPTARSSSRVDVARARAVPDTRAKP